jgi:hypothetical protein
MRIAENLTGQRFGKLSVIKRDGVSKAGGPRWLCRCDCGVEKHVVTGNLKCGRTVSCGCVQRTGNRAKLLRHGMSKTRTYKIWLGMKRRCYNKSNHAYERYGGRGITVCERWHTFENFLADMGEATGTLSIERINNDGNYCPDNCRWIEKREQSLNQRRTIYVWLGGERMTLSAASGRLGVSYFALYDRLRDRAA